MKAAIVLGVATLCASPEARSDTAIALLRQGDVFARTAHGMVQLTHDGHNSDLATSRDGSLLAFVRNEGQDSDGEPLNSLWLCTVVSGECRRLVAPHVAEKPQDDLAAIETPQFSYQARALADGRAIGSVFFATRAWQTSGAVHRVTLGLPTKQSFVADSNGFAVVPGGQFAGALELCQHRYHPQGGSFDQHVIFDPNTGQQLQHLSTECGD